MRGLSPQDIDPSQKGTSMISHLEMAVHSALPTPLVAAICPTCQRPLCDPWLSAAIDHVLLLDAVVHDLKACLEEGVPQ
jgi:hypothetical protein